MKTAPPAQERRLTDPQPASRYHLTSVDQVQLLRKLLLYWDGQWFLKTVEAFGLAAAVDLNSQVRASFGSIEMRLLLKALGKSHASDLPDAVHMLETYADTFMGARLRAEFSAPGDGRAEVTIRRCAAFEGAKRAGLPRVDQACVACETLWRAWLETLLPGVQAKVRYPSRLGKGDPLCQFIIQIDTGPETR